VGTRRGIQRVYAKLVSLVFQFHFPLTDRL